MMHHSDNNSAPANTAGSVDQAAGVSPKPLTPAAQRALAEAAERRRLAEAEQKKSPKEFNGPSGPEPTRYGDWERKGIASDF
jgi:hypothetical protein